MKKSLVVGCFSACKRRATKKGFTLIELLVVVLIIAVIVSIALPAYNRAILRSRYKSLASLTKAINQGQEIYFLTKGRYADKLNELDVQVADVNSNTLTTEDGITVTTSGDDDGYNYVLATRRGMDNTYIMYQKHSHNYPGEIHCEAQNDNDLANWLCQTALKAKKSIGQTITQGYTTYVLEGNGNGIAPGADEDEQDENGQRVVSCTKAEEMGFTCTLNEDKTVKKICKDGMCRITTYDEEGGYTKVTCKADGSNGEGVCTSDWVSYTYDANGNMLTRRACSSLDSNGNCSRYSWGSRDYTYDAKGNMLTERSCYTVDSSGKCTGSGPSSYDYTYDAKGNMLTARACSSVDSSGTCTQYDSYNNYDYTYDANGNMLTRRACGDVDSNGNCSGYSWGTDYTYDAKGNMLTARSCSSVDSNDNCTAYSSGYNYTYDANGKLQNETACYGFDSNGNCTVYSMWDEWLDEWSGQSTTYLYDDEGKQIAKQSCSGSSVNSDTGECSGYGTAVSNN